MNKVVVKYKPPFISSNRFLTKIKKEYRVKKAGFSGTLDPFASGSIIIAFGAYTKLFRFLKKYPKVYRATIWLGAHSKSLDLENIYKIEDIEKLEPSRIKETILSFKGEFKYRPPLFSAKKIDGKRAYKLAKENKDIELKEINSTIYDIKLISYNHPFITFEATVSEGTYIRSLAEHICKKLKTPGTLSSLERLKEGEFSYKKEPKNILNYLKTKRNFTSLKKEDIKSGKKIELNSLQIKEDGEYHLVFDDFFTIIKIEDKKVKYLLNNIPKEEL